MRLLAREPLRYRRQILGLKQFFVGRNCTVLLLDDRTSQAGDLQLQSIAHGVITLEQLAPEYGAERRRLRIVKMRGVRFQGGFHDFVIATGGVARLSAAGRGRVPERTRERRRRAPASPGSTICSAADSIAARRRCSSARPAPASPRSRRSIAVAAAQRGEHVAMYLFDEGLDTFRRRAAGLGTDVTEHVDERPHRADAGRPGRTVAGRVRRPVRAAVDAGSRVGRRDRQLERLSERDARRALPGRAAARAVHVPAPARRARDLRSSRSTAWSGRCRRRWI